jgi:hypothetical protein
MRRPGPSLRPKARRKPTKLETIGNDALDPKIHSGFPSADGALRMDTDQSPVIVTEGATAQTTRVYHRDFPEIRADGGSLKEAASHLANKLALALDTALTDWRRQTLGQAIADVKAFVKLQG